MWPVVGIPPMWAELLDRFRDCFRRSDQFQHFAEYVIGLIVASRFSVQALNDLFTGHRHASTKRRFMDAAPWSTEKVMRRLVRLVKEHAGFSKPSRGFLVIDDTILEHDMDTKAMEKVAVVKDPETQHWVNGHVVVTAHWVTPRGHFPVGFRLKTPGGISKHHLALWLIKKCRRFGILFQTVVFDSWYLAETLTEPLGAWGLTWVSRLRLDRVYLANGGRREKIVTYFQGVARTTWQTQEIDGRQETFAAACLTLTNHARVKVVALQKADVEGGLLLLVTNATHWLPDSIVRAYNHRWTIEAFYRDGKQNLGLEAYMLRSAEGAKRHLCLGLVAFTLLQLGAQHPRLGRLMRDHVASVGEMCQRTVTETARMFLTWSMKWIGQGLDPTTTVSLAFMSRRQLRCALTPL
jgi:SRSO17 transposase